ARNLLVVTEVALSLVLLFGARLMLRPLFELHSINPGFDASNVLTMRVSIPADKFPSPSGEINFFHEVLHRVRALPGVRAAGTIASFPLGRGRSHHPVSIVRRGVLTMADPPAG